MHSPEQEIAGMWNAMFSALTMATYVVGAFIVLLFIAIALADFFGKRRARSVNAAAQVQEATDAAVPDADRTRAANAP
ncbi:MAG TPA: hypothetical protein VL426_06385 [Candidatus Binatia bacterium]|nr:hypothetical protein [Candidatus Binatia bacterium]